MTYFKSYYDKIAALTLFSLFTIHSALAQNSSFVTFKNGDNEVQVPKIPKKVLVFDLSVLETFQELDIPVAAVPNSLPKHLEKYNSTNYAKLGTLTKPDMSAIKAFKPDFIITSGRQSTYYDSLAVIAPTINLNIDQHNFWASLEENVLTIATLYNKEDLAKKKLAILKKKVDKVNKKSAKDTKKAVTALYIKDRFIPNGPGSRFGFVNDIIGIKPAYVETEAYKNSKKEEKIAIPLMSEINPDYLFVIDRETAINGGIKNIDEILNNDLRKTNAYKNNNIFIIPGQIWYLSGSGLISVDQKITDISQKIYNLKL